MLNHRYPVENQFDRPYRGWKPTHGYFKSPVPGENQFDRPFRGWKRAHGYFKPSLRDDAREDPFSIEKIPFIVFDPMQLKE